MLPHPVQIHSLRVEGVAAAVEEVKEVPRDVVASQVEALDQVGIGVTVHHWHLPGKGGGSCPARSRWMRFLCEQGGGRCRGRNEQPEGGTGERGGVRRSCG